MPTTHANLNSHSQKIPLLILDPIHPFIHPPPMLTRKHIELGAKIFIVLHLIVFCIYTLDVMKMMGFFGGK